SVEQFRARTGRCREEVFVGKREYAEDAVSRFIQSHRLRDFDFIHLDDDGNFNGFIRYGLSEIVRGTMSAKSRYEESPVSSSGYLWSDFVEISSNLTTSLYDDTVGFVLEIGRRVRFSVVAVPASVSQYVVGMRNRS